MQLKESRYNVNIKMKGGRRLLYNSLSRSLCLLDAEETLLMDTSLDDISGWDNGKAATLQHLQEQGYVLPKQLDELAIVQQLYNQTRYGAKAMNLIVCPTLGCNFACDYCFQGADKPFNTMSEAVMDGIVNLFQKTLNKRPDLQHVQFVWYGGEPLMGKQIIYDLADRLIAICNKSKITYSAMMVSNGFLMKKDVAKELAARGLNLVQITLDGSEEHHDARRHLLSKKGTYQKILGNVEEWIDEIPITVNIRVNIDERNKEDIRNLIDDLETRGLSGKQNFRMYFSPVESMTLGCHNVSEKMMQKMNYGQLEASLYRYAFKKNLTDLPYPMRFMGICSAIRPYDYIVVPNGDIHKCWDTVSFPSKRVGTLADVDAILDQNHQPVQEWESFDPFVNEICRSCKILPNCAGYCAYKFINAADTSGQAILPCPSLKYSINERIVLKAEMEGYITKDDYLPEDIKTDPYYLTPKMHTVESMKGLEVPVA